MKVEIPGEQTVQLEISIEKLAYLFESDVICAAEIRCLTAQTKQQVSERCLSSCAKKIACDMRPKDESSQALQVSF